MRCRLWCDEGGRRSPDQLYGQGTWARRITVNVVAPGAIATNFSGGVVRDHPEVNTEASMRSSSCWDRETLFL
jgi:NAD(P)-dependent dehydrogenase (short-subunit alcohol dehydrogenase family)